MIARHKKPSDYLASLPEWLLYTAVGALVLDQGAKRLLGLTILTTANNDLRIPIGIAAVSLLSIIVPARLRQLESRLSQFTNKYLGVLEVLHPYEIIDLARMLEHSTRIRVLTLSGTKAVALSDDKVRALLTEPKRRAQITLLLANPYSDAIQTRYKCDEPATFEAGPEGIKRRLVWLHSVVSSLPEAARSRLDVRIYDNYPVVSIVQADNHIYSTSYGFKLRGGDCPKLHSDVNGEYGMFLSKHFDRVYAAATPLSEWMEKHGPAAEVSASA